VLGIMKRVSSLSNLMMLPPSLFNIVSFVNIRIPFTNALILPYFI